MAYKLIALDSLVVNPANDRHGELENETAAIARLFALREQHMRNLAKDLVEKGEIFEPPLVYPDGATFIVFDGNRRTTCLKLLANPRRAPTVELQEFFADLRKQWKGTFPQKIQCQVETDRDRIDDILFRRHTGSQNGVGQSTWDDRMKDNFVTRTGKGGGINVADEVERRLAAANLLPGHKRIPRSNMNRLLSAEAFRNRLGFTIRKGKFEFTRREPVVLAALSRVARDLAAKTIVLGDIWDVDGKSAYLDKLENEGVLPTSADTIATQPPSKPSPPKPKPAPTAKPSTRTTVIPQIEYGVAWAGRIQRHRAIWDELQFKLNLSEHPNAISVLFRVLLELSVDNYITQTKLTTVHENDKAAKKILRVAEDIHAQGKIDKKYLGVFQKAQNLDPLISMDTLNRYVHSPNFAPSPDHLKALWDTLADFVVHCLNS